MGYLRAGASAPAHVIAAQTSGDGQRPKLKFRIIGDIVTFLQARPRPLPGADR
jgi:hypothetical protein